ncbi:MAG: hypothetical protein HUK13_10375, partial [Muribaculaceae bacterium]|nr:hypothetical protein [Muribaculaceae bacterium]
MPKKISKIAKDLNIALPTVIEFLRKKNITIEENPNTRVDEDVENLLIGEFQRDKDLKTKSTEIISSSRKKEPKPEKKEAPVEEVTIEAGPKPKILGKLQLDANGNPIVVNKPAEKPAEAPKANPEAPKAPEAPAKQEPAPEQKPAEAPKAPEAAKPAEPAQPAKEEKPKAEQKPQPKPEQKKEQGKPQDKQHKGGEQKHQPKQQPANEANPQPKPEEKPAEQPEAPEKKEEEIFNTPAPKPPVNLSIVGKIDLSAINQSTRPKKKSREEKRNERRNNNNGQGGAKGTEANAEGGNSRDRKKRRRISGKEKVDIEKT